MLGKLKVYLYGTRDAAKGWQETLSPHLERIGCVRGRGHPSVFWHSERSSKILAHGDDYVSAGDEASMTWMEQELAKAYEIQIQKLGMGKDCQQDAKVLNRIIRCTNVGWEVEADPRHAELVVEQLGIVDKGVSAPGVSGSEEEDEENVPILGRISPDIVELFLVATTWQLTDQIAFSQSKKAAGK